MRRVTVLLPSEMLQRLDQRAALTGVSRSAVVRSILDTRTEAQRPADPDAPAAIDS